MKYFDDVYLRRLNRFGYDYQTRVQNKRELEFESLLNKSVYRIDFSYKNKIIPACFEPDKQDETQVTFDLLTRVGTEIDQGEILFIPYASNHNFINGYLVIIYIPITKKFK